MATPVAPFGFRPVRTMSGSPWSASVQHVLMSGAANCFVGDLVKFVTDGAAAGKVVNGIKCDGMIQGTSQTATTTGADTIGVIVGFLPDLTNLSTNYRVASTDRIALVCTGRDVVYEVQEDAVGGNFAAADMGLCCSIVATAGNTATGRSKQTIDSNGGTTAVTATLPVRLIGLAHRPGMTYGTSTTDAAIFEVVLNSAWTGVMAAGV